MEKKTKKYLLMFLALILAVALILFAVRAFAAPFLVCDCQDTVTYYEIQIDSGSVINSPAVTAECTNGQKRLSLDMGPLGITDGQHSLVGRACVETGGAVIGGCSSDVPFDFSKGVPSTQSGIGLSPTP